MTAKSPVPGDVFYFDPSYRGNPHLWMVLTPTDQNGQLVLASLTESINYPINTDIWPRGFQLTPEYKLGLASVIHIKSVRVADVWWLLDQDAEYRGQAVPEALKRARCNICWWYEQLAPRVDKYLRASFDYDWEDDC